jgi:signal transduction histidine kinase
MQEEAVRKGKKCFRESKYFYTSRIKFIIFAILIGLLWLHFGCTKADKNVREMDLETLENERNTLPDCPRKVDILNELAYRYSYSEPKLAKECADQALEIAEQKIEYPEGIAASLNSLGLYHFIQSNYDEAKKYYKKGLTKSREIKYKTGEAQAIVGIGRCHQVRGEFVKGLENFLEAEKICKKIGEKRELANAYYGLGALYYYDPEDYKEALENFKECRELGEKISDKRIETSGFYAIGEMYQKQGNVKEAIENFNKCLKISEKVGNIYNMANAYEGFGDTYIKFFKLYKGFGNIDRSFDITNFLLKYLILINYTESLRLFEQIRDEFQIAEIKKRLARLYIIIGNHEEALKYLSDALKRAEKVEVPVTIRDVSGELSKLYQEKQQYELALGFHKQFKKNSDFLKKNEMHRQKVIYDLKKEKERDKFVRNFLIVGFVFVLIGALVILRSYERERRAYKDVERMSEIGKLITSNLSQKGIYNIVYEHVKEVMDAEVFLIFTYDERSGRLVYLGGKEEGVKNSSQYFELKEKNRPAVKCFLEQRTLIFKEYRKEYPKIFGESPPIPKKGKSFNSHIFLPLILEGSKDQGNKKIGVITVQSERKNAYTDYHVNILKNIGTYAAIALDNANAYEQIEEQKAKKDDLMYTVSHQYKTPLANISSSAQILRDYLPRLSEEDVRKYFNKVFSNLDRATELIDHLLLFGKTFNPGYYDLQEFCQNFVDEVSSNEGSKHKIVFESEGECNQVKMDKDFMGIILKNLVENSINYSPEGSTISIDLKCDEKNAVIKVADEGRGIPEDYLKMPFERYHRGSNVRSVNGTGLGLPIVKRYVELHNGNIKIDSKLNQGTAITIRIPKNS